MTLSPVGGLVFAEQVNNECWYTKDKLWFMKILKTESWKSKQTVRDIKHKPDGTIWLFCWNQSMRVGKLLLSVFRAGKAKRSCRRDALRRCPSRRPLRSPSVVPGQEESLIDWWMAMEMPCTMTLRSATLQPPNKPMGSAREEEGYIHVKPTQTKTPCFSGARLPPPLQAGYINKHKWKEKPYTPTERASERVTDRQLKRQIVALSLGGWCAKVITRRRGAGGQRSECVSDPSLRPSLGKKGALNASLYALTNSPAPRDSAVSFSTLSFSGKSWDSWISPWG